MSRTCLCCRKPLTRQTCDYCGFVDVEVLSEDAETFLAQEIREYAESLASDITEISVNSAVYEWKEETSRLEMTSRKIETKIADGAECFAVRKWGGQDYGQQLSGKRIKLELSYRYMGKKKQLTCTVPTARCDDFWRVGVKIDNQLQLKVYLGSEKKYTESEALDLELR